jgi:hypothetical protein
MVIGVVGALIAGFALGLPLMVLMIPFLVALCLPLFLQTSLHPAIAVDKEGLHLNPLIWRGHFVRWEDLEGYTQHHLLRPPAPKMLKRKGRDPQEGLLIIGTTNLPWHYRVVGLLAGKGLRPVFGISNWTHVDYAALRNHIRKNLREIKEE